MADTAVLGVRVDYDPSGAQAFSTSTEQMASSAGTAAQAIQNLSAATQQYEGRSKMVADQLRAAGVGYNAVTNTFYTMARAQDQATAAAKAGTSATQVQTEAQKGLGSTLAATAGELTTWAAGLFAGYKLVSSAIDEFKASLAAASNIQQAQFQLTQLSGSAELAAKQVNELRELATEQGAFDFSQLENAERRMLLLRGGTEGLTQATRDLAAMALKSGEDVNSMTTAYARLQMSIQTGTAPVQRGVAGITVLMAALREETGKTDQQLREAFKAGEINIQTVDKAMHDYANATKTFSDYNKTWEGQIGVLQHKWEEVRAAFGTPILDALGPALAAWGEKITKFTEQFGGLEHMAYTLGDAFGLAIRNFDLRGLDKITDQLVQQLHNAIYSGVESGAKAGWAYLTNLFKDFTINVGLAFHAVGASAAQLAGAAGTEAGLPGAYAGVPSYPTLTVTGAPPPSEQVMPTGERFYKTTPTPETPPRAIPPFAGGAGRGGESDWEKYKSDLVLINNYWEQYNIIQSKATTETERQRRVMELTLKTAKQLYDPSQFNPYLGKIGDAIIAHEELERRIKELSEAAKIGYASMGDALELGFLKAQESFGTWQTQISDAIPKIGQALSTDIAGGLEDIFNGTKSVAEGFKAMALSIVRDLEKIAVELLVNITLERIFGGLGGAAGTGAFSFSQGGYVPYATGGYVRGFAPGGYTGDVSASKIAGVVHGGEFVFSAAAVRSLGLNKLYEMHNTASRGYAGGGYVGNGSTTQQSTTQVNLSVHYHSDGTMSRDVRSKGTANDKARIEDLERAVVPVIDKWAVKNKQFGGMLHSSTAR